MDKGPGRSAEVLFEFKQIGAQMRVAAIDSATGIEVVVIAPSSSTPMQMQTLALAKLRRRLAEGDSGAPPRRV